MHDIHMAEVTEDFARCWNAAGLHIQNQAQGPIQSWLRAHLNPPFLEHLSFRLGNQLFFIQLEDTEGVLETPGNPGGLLAVADKSNGHACVMPMRRIGLDWEPAESGWGLLDARTRKPVNPAALISDENIEMTDWEVQDLAVQVVRHNLAEEGKKLISWDGNPEIYPSIWFVGDSGDDEWVVVSAVRYPLHEAEQPAFIQNLKAHPRFGNLAGHFASVSVANADDPFDGSAETENGALPLYRGHAMHIRYEGLKAL